MIKDQDWVFPTDSPAHAGSLGRGCEEGLASQTGAHDAGAEDGDDADQAPTGEGSLWPATFLLSNISGAGGGKREEQVSLSP